MMAPAQYFRDPCSQNVTKWIGKFNNIDHKIRRRYIKNLAKVKQIVLVGSPDDEMLMPWQSSQFGFYDKDFVVHGLEESTEWVTLGLSKLGKKLVVLTLNGMKHYDYLKEENQEWMADEVYPYLM